jgi:ribonucleoside-diphosphate reductase alpha chain
MTDETPVTDGRPKIPETSEVLSAVRVRQATPFKHHLHVIITVEPKSGRELEVFAQIGSAGGVPGGNLEAICRIVSLYLRNGGALTEAIKQLKGISCHMTKNTKDGYVESMGDALGIAMQRYLDAKEKHGLEALLTGEVNIGGERNERQEDKSVQGSGALCHVRTIEKA